VSDENYFERASEDALVELVEMALTVNREKALRLVSEVCRGYFPPAIDRRLSRVAMDARFPTQTK
jgi:hypothetical protein